MRMLTFVVGTVGLFAVLAVIGPHGCTDEETAVRATKGFGFSDIETTGYSIYGCSESDSYHTRFRAKNIKGDVVTGVVCSSWSKNATVRLD